VKVNGEEIQPVEGSYSFSMPEAVATVTAEFSCDWSELQSAIDNGGTVTLTADVIAPPGSSPLVVASGKTVILDLNGCTIDRGLKNASAQADGYVLVNNGTLTITDSNAGTAGSITGGNCSGDVGGVINAGTLTLAGGTITGNTASGSAGGDYELPECGFTVPAGICFREWSVVIGNADPVVKVPGDTITVTANTTVTAVWDISPFGEPDFILPADLSEIGAEAFKGVAMSVTEIPAGCTSVGDYAFRDCTGLSQIRIPADCALGTDVFDGCMRVYVFSTAGSPAEAYCNDPEHKNCVFVEDRQN